MWKLIPTPAAMISGGFEKCSTILRKIGPDFWVYRSALGWLEVKIGDVKGGQYIGRLAGEFVPFRHWGFGVAGNLSMVDVDWQGIESPNEDDELRAKIALDINDINLYIRYRFYAGHFMSHLLCRSKGFWHSFMCSSLQLPGRVTLMGAHPFIFLRHPSYHRSGN